MNRFMLAVIVFLCLLSTGCEKEQLIFDEITFDTLACILPDYLVKAIDFDSKGNAWIGTSRQGLIKYDGKSVIVYNSENSILPEDPIIWDLKVDHDDNIWIGTEGLVKFDGEFFQIFNTGNSPLLEDFVSIIAVDQNNIVWLASCRHREGGLMSYNGKTWKSYTPENSPLPDNLIQDIVIDKYNNVWLAVNRCLIKISRGKWTIYDESKLGFQPYHFGHLAIGRYNLIIASIDYSLSSSGHFSGPHIIQFNGEKCIINNPVDEQGNSLGYVEVMNTDSRGNIWASVGIGKFRISAYNGQSWHYKDIDTLWIPVHTITSDPYNRIWIGTSTGIYIIEQN
jgi:ligand-binding sensor domain-containing protein